MILAVPYNGFGLSLPSVIQKGLKSAASTVVAEVKKVGRELDPTALTAAQRAQIEAEMRDQKAAAQMNLKTPLLIGAGLAALTFATLFLLRRRRGRRRSS